MGVIAKNNSLQLVAYPAGDIFIEDNGGVDIVAAATFTALARNRKNHLNLTNAGTTFTLATATTFISEPDNTVYDVAPKRNGDQIVLVVEEAQAGVLTITLGAGFITQDAIVFASGETRVMSFEYGTFAGESGYILVSNALAVA